MDYQGIYNSLIANAISRGTVDGYKETHHIKPRSMGGTDDKSNLVQLTAREHFVAHILLAKIYGGNLWFAVLAMASGSNRKEKYFNSKLYDIAKRENSIVRSKAMNGTKLTTETVVKLSIALIGNTNASGKRTKEAKENISKSLIGRKLSPEHAKKTRMNALGNKSRLGQKNTDETRRKMSFSHQCRNLNKLIDSVFADNQNHVEVSYA